MSTAPSSEDKTQKIKEVFSQLNRKFQEADTQRRAQSIQLPYFDLRGFPIDQEALMVVPEVRARAVQAIPFFNEARNIRLGLVDPGVPGLKDLIAELEAAKYKIELYLVSAGGFDSALAQYKKVLTVTAAQQQEVAVSTDPSALDQLKNVAAAASPAETTRLLGLILGSAVGSGASDVHMEPEETDLKLRFRMDGVLQDMATLPMSYHHALISRIKLSSHMKLNVTSTPQDGRFSVRAAERHIDLRVSILPSAHGESVVIRILGMSAVSVDIENLGLSERDLALLKAELDKPNGMILTTGPTGSGKTTTLYAFLRYLKRGGVKIITLEDPVEYQIDGITQTPIDHKAGMDFAKGLRSILRQDPDIVMVGEIRDFETAETAAQASLTGHMVLSTLHTNDAAGAIPRLLDLGVKPVTLAPALNALIAQRLLRKICQDCREPYKPDFKELDRIKQILAAVSEASKEKVPQNLTFYHSPGCEKCHNVGYKGRIGIFEVFAVEDDIEKLVYNQTSSLDIKKAAIKSGMLTMQQDGILKAARGLTDLAEVWRMTEE